MLTCRAPSRSRLARDGPTPRPPPPQPHAAHTTHTTREPPHLIHKPIVSTSDLAGLQVCTDLEWVEGGISDLLIHHFEHLEGCLGRPAPLRQRLPPMSFRKISHMHLPPFFRGKGLPLTRLTSLRLASQKVCTGRMCGNSSAPTLTCKRAHNQREAGGSALRLRGAILKRWSPSALRGVSVKGSGRVQAGLPAVPWPR